jgi:uncharacterized membrane protein YtjA (UPF0391 family)
MEMAAPRAYNKKESRRVSRTQDQGKTLDSGPTKKQNTERQEVVMLRWALGFFIVALIAAVLGFSGVALAAAGIAKILFYIFLVLFLVSLVSHLLRRT